MRVRVTMAPSPCVIEAGFVAEAVSKDCNHYANREGLPAEEKDEDSI